ncbi:Phosphatidylinositol-3-phosphatase SAC1 [Elasticomyces elasticus]|nr:Phosphatidylinositol-3-phosphatase SAC1 [Elasticomyces elasticus]
MSNNTSSNMSKASLDVEALLESASKEVEAKSAAQSDKDRKGDKGDRKSIDRYSDRGRRDRSSERDGRSRDLDGDEEMKDSSDKASANGSLRSRRRSNSHGSNRRPKTDRRQRGPVDPDDAFRASGGDFYRGGGRPRTRSRSPIARGERDTRHYRPSGRNARRDRDYDRRGPRERSRERDRERERERDRHRGDRDRDRDRERNGRRSSDTPKVNKTPEPTEDERDRRTIFVQQLSLRCRTKELIAFFEKVGPVKEAQIVKDRVNNRSKGYYLLSRPLQILISRLPSCRISVGYVEFRNEESVQPAIQLTGQKLLGLPIIAQHTEAEKNRMARTTEGGASTSNGVPFHRLYVGNIHFSITENDLQNVFEPFGELEFVQLQKEDMGRSKGYGFVQFLESAHAKEALEKMNGFEIAGRPIRVGLGNDKFTPESTANFYVRNFLPNQPTFQGSAFSGLGGRGAHAGGTGNFDRAGGRDLEKGAGGASALDDTDVSGVNFNNYSRDSLMRKLARTDEPADPKAQAARARIEMKKPIPANVPAASRCIVIHNAFDPNTETEDGWVADLEADVKDECQKKYGPVVYVEVAVNSPGDIYVEFERVQGGENALKGLNGRFFDGRTISANPVVEAIFRSMVSRKRAL